MQRNLLVAIASLFMLGSAVASVAAAETMPDGFVWLRDVDPTIEQDIRYYGMHNAFAGPVPGYQAQECILTRQAADALAGVQRELAASKLSLKVYDCYRPQTAVEHFFQWSSDASEQSMKAEFYPHFDKVMAFDKGFISHKSGHTRGSTIDLTIVPAEHAAERAYVPGEPLIDCTLPANQRFPDSSIDFGTGFDCIDERSHHGNTDVPPVAQMNRLMFKDLMERHGFVHLPEEWWHYTLKDEPFPDTYFDFPVTAKAYAGKPAQ